MGNLFDYVMHTPGNTNPAVLSSEILKLIDENVVQANWTQENRNAKDYIKNKPGGYTYEYPSNGTKIDLTTITPGIYKVAQWNESYVSSGSQELLNSLVGFSAMKIPYITNRYYHWGVEIDKGRQGTNPFRYNQRLIQREIPKIGYTFTQLDENNYIASSAMWNSIPVYLIVDLNTLDMELKNDFPTRGIYLKVPQNYECPNLSLWPIQTAYFSTYYDSAFQDMYVNSNMQSKKITSSGNRYFKENIEDVLDQIGGQLNEYFGYTIEEDSVINGTYNSGTIKVPIDGFEFGTCYLARGQNEDFIAGYPIHTSQGIIALGDIASYSKYKAVISAVTDEYYNLNFLTDPPFLSTTEGQVALKFYPIHFDKKTKELLAMELGSGYVSPDNLVTSPVFFRDGKLVTTERVDVKQYFDGAPDALVEGGLGYGTVFLESASTENQDSRYSSWGLTTEDYPLMATMTKQELSGTSPTYEYKVITSTGRCFKVGGTAATAFSWSPTEIYPSQLIVKSSTADSTKNFKITVDDTGAVTATELT